MRSLSSTFSLAPDDLLRDRPYRRLWTSILISSFGNQVTMLAIPLTAAVMLQASSAQMSYIQSMELLPFVLLSLPTGVWLDGRRKLPVYVGGELAIACTVATIPLAAWLGWLSVLWLYFTAFVIGTVNTTAGSAAQIVLTQVVPRTRLVEAHAKNALASSTAEVAGPGFAGVLIKLTGPPFALLADAVLLLISATILRGVPVQETPTALKEKFWGAMRAGIDFVRTHRLLVALASCVGVWQLSNNCAMTQQILFATRTLGLSARAVGLSYVALGIGTIGTSSVGARIARRMGPGPTLVMGFAVCGLGWLQLALAPSYRWGVAAYPLMLFAFGVGAVLIFINFLSLRQSVTPAPMLGRMTSTMRWLILLPSVPGALLGGWLGTQFGVRAALGFSGVAAILLALVAWRLPIIRNTRTLPTLRAEAVTPFSADEPAAP
jgi:MFS family permease